MQHPCATATTPFLLGWVLWGRSLTAAAEWWVPRAPRELLPLALFAFGIARSFGHEGFPIGRKSRPVGVASSAGLAASADAVALSPLVASRLELVLLLKLLLLCPALTVGEMPDCSTTAPLAVAPLLVDSESESGCHVPGAMPCFWEFAA